MATVHPCNLVKNFKENSKQGFIHHRNLVLAQERRSRSNETVFNSIPNKPESLDEWIKNCGHYKSETKWEKEENKFMNDFTITVLLQIAHAVHELHRCEIICENVEASAIYFTQDRKNLVLTERADVKQIGGRDEGRSEDRKKSDINSLGKLFYYVLSGLQSEVKKKSLLCKEPEIALDLIEKMLKKSFTKTGDVLKHPFFWRANKKISFICEIVDYIKDQEEKNKAKKKEMIKHLKSSKEEKKNTKEEKDNHDNNMDKGANNGDEKEDDEKLVLETEVLNDLDWIESLRLTNEELRSYKRIKDEHGSCKGDEELRSNERKDDKHSSRKGIRDDTIIKLTENWKDKKKKKTIYGKNSIYELLRFIRNRRAHYLEHDKIVRVIFKNCTDGFWEFFSDRFPWLFWHSYTKMKDRLEKASGHDFYLVDVAENADIQPLPKNNNQQQKEKEIGDMNPSSSTDRRLNPETHKRKISETSGSETGKRRKT